MDVFHSGMINPWLFANNVGEHFYVCMIIMIANQISVREIHNSSKEKMNKHKEIYITVLNRIYSRIRRCASVNMDNCKYVVPEIVIGYPLFNTRKCIMFAAKHLQVNGFDVEIDHNMNLMNIYWGIQKKIENKNMVETAFRDPLLPISTQYIPKYKPISTFTPNSYFKLK